MKAYALIGYPLEHTYSPFLHKLIFTAWALPHTYIAWEVLPSELAVGVEMFRRNFAGFNVTSPHKKEIIPLLDELDLSAEIFSAVNTVKNEDGRLIGYNTDGVGFMAGLERLDYDATDKHILILGAGGAAYTVALELARLGCSFTIANREVETAYQLKLYLDKRFPNVDSEVCNIERIPRQKYEMIVNATPVGMPPLVGHSPIHPSYLEGAELVYDLNYNPARSLLLQQAEQAGCLVESGLPMLVYQGIRSQEIWQGRKASPEMGEEILAVMAKEVQK